MDAQHRGLQTPLLTDEEVSRSIRPSHAPLEPQEQETDAKYFVRAPSIILGLLFLEITAFHGVYLNLVVYLQQVLHGDNASNAANVSTWAAASYLMPLLGAALADSCLGKYKTSLLCLCIFLAGLVIVTASATLPSFRPPPCDQSTYCVPATTAQSAVFFSGIYLCAIGCGGVKSTLLSFGAEQFHDDDRDKNPRERERKASYFSCYYAIANLGILTAGTVLVWIEDRVSWGLGYGVCASCIALALVGFAAGTPTYRILLPAGGPFKSAVQVLVASLRKASLRAPVDASLLDVEDVKTSPHPVRERLEHTDQFRCLNKAAIVTDSDLEHGDPWKLCTVTQVEELKVLLRLVPIWVTSAVYFIANTQVQTTFVQQGTKMDCRITRALSVPAASLASFETLSVAAFVVLYNKAVAPTARRCLRNAEAFTPLQRMGFGHATGAIAMAVAAYTEACRLERAKAGRAMSIGWLLPQYLAMAVSDASLSIGQLEFFYDQSPETTRGASTAFYFLSVSLGSLLNSQIIKLVASVTTAGGTMGWIPVDLDDGHLDYYFLLLAGITIVNFVAYIVLAKNYTAKRVR